MWADVMAKRQADGTLLALKVVVRPPEIRIKGPISAKPEDPNGIGDWTIAGLTIMVTDKTKISDRGGPLDVDDWAEVYALRDGVKLIAVRMRGIEIQPDVEIFGAIEAFSATKLDPQRHRSDRERRHADPGRAGSRPAGPRRGIAPG